MYNSIVTVIDLWLAYSNAQTTFSYDNPSPDYVVGVQITPNKPNITNEEGTFSISPQLSKGLSLDSKTGIISGTPEEQYQAQYAVMYMILDEVKMASKIDIKSMNFVIII